ncbi:MAG: hypothetical protein LBM08_07535, partial [Dysgonamonadaceae bacterium]|nr:hypothetical protein [Dysgonamonadaceae bacterium]
PEYYVLRVDEFDSKAVTPLDEWISFLKTGDIPEDAKAGGLPEARERLRRDRLSKEEQRAYDSHIEDLRVQRGVMQTSLFEGREEGREEGINEGIKIGIEKGREEGLKEGREKTLYSVAERALKNGMSPEGVMELTGLTKEEISSLKLIH